MAVVYSNNSSTALSSGITNSATSIAVGSVTGFPTLSGSDYYYATLANVTNTKIEIVKVTAAAGTTLTVVRGQDNTTAVSFDASDNLQLRVTAATLESATSTDVSITGGSVATSTITDATASAKGLATAAQITKLDGIATSANNYTHPTGAGYNHIPTGGSVGQILKNTASGTATWQADNNTTYSVGDGGLTSNDFTDADHTKLNAIEASADVTDSTNVVAALTAGTNVTISSGGTIASTDTNTVYTHPNHSGDVVSTADGATVIQVDAVDIAMLSATGTASATTFLRGDNSWVTPTDTDTNTTYTASTGMSLAGTAFSCTIDSPSEVGLGNLSSSGNNLSGSFTATGNITAYSDLRLKSNIEVIDDALAKVMSLRGVTFDMNEERSTGVIAQELETVLPEAVRDNDVSGMKSVAYGNIVGLLVEAIKELSAKVEQLENR